MRRVILIGGYFCTVNTGNYHLIRFQLPGLTCQIRYYPENRDRGLNSANLLSDHLRLLLPFLLELHFHLSFNLFFFSFTLFYTQLITMVSSSPRTRTPSTTHPTIKPACPIHRQPIASPLANFSIPQLT